MIKSLKNLNAAPLLESAQKYVKAIEFAYLGHAKNYIITCCTLCIFKYRAKKLFVVKIEKSPQRCFSPNLLYSWTKYQSYRCQLSNQYFWQCSFFF